MFGRRKEESGGAASASAGASHKACPRCAAVIRCVSSDSKKECDASTYTINMRDGRVYTYSIKKEGNGGSSFNIVQVEDVARGRNRVACAACGCRFCWLCARELPRGAAAAAWHFCSLSTGCAPRGRAVWSRRKKVLWALGLALGSVPAGALLASVATYVAFPHLVAAGAPLWAVLAVAALLGLAVGAAGLCVRRRMNRVR